MRGGASRGRPPGRAGRPGTTAHDAEMAVTPQFPGQPGPAALGSGPQAWTGVRALLKASDAGSMIRQKMRTSSQQVESVQRRVARGEYVVNSQQVATAMLERIGATISHQEVVSEAEGGRALMRALTGLRAA